MKWGVIVLLVLFCGYAMASLEENEIHKYSREELFSILIRGAKESDDVMQAMKQAIQLNSPRDTEDLCKHAPAASIGLEFASSFLERAIEAWCPGDYNSPIMNFFFLFDMKKTQEFCDAWTVIQQSLGDIAETVDLAYEEACHKEEKE
jgi:hypothetical protein